MDEKCPKCGCKIEHFHSYYDAWKSCLARIKELEAEVAKLKESRDAYKGSGK